MPDVTATYGTHLDFISFFLGIFIGYRRAFMLEVSPNFYRFYVGLLYIYFGMSNVTAGYGRFSYSIAFYGNFSYIYTCFKRYNFTKLLQTVCLGRSLEMKSKPL